MRHTTRTWHGRGDILRSLEQLVKDASTLKAQGFLERDHPLTSFINEFEVDAAKATFDLIMGAEQWLLNNQKHFVAPGCTIAKISCKICDEYKYPLLYLNKLRLLKQKLSNSNTISSDCGQKILDVLMAYYIAHKLQCQFVMITPFNPYVFLLRPFHNRNDSYNGVDSSFLSFKEEKTTPIPTFFICFWGPEDLEIMSSVQEKNGQKDVFVVDNRVVRVAEGNIQECINEGGEREVKNIDEGFEQDYAQPSILCQPDTFDISKCVNKALSVNGSIMDNWQPFGPFGFMCGYLSGNYCNTSMIVERSSRALAIRDAYLEVMLEGAHLYEYEKSTMSLNSSINPTVLLHSKLKYYTSRRLPKIPNQRHTKRKMETLLNYSNVEAILKQPCRTGSPGSCVKFKTGDNKKVDCMTVFRTAPKNCVANRTIVEMIVGWRDFFYGKPKYEIKSDIMRWIDEQFKSAIAVFKKDYAEKTEGGIPMPDEYPNPPCLLKYTFFGIEICKEAWHKLTGISAGLFDSLKKDLLSHRFFKIRRTDGRFLYSEHLLATIPRENKANRVSFF